MRTELTNEEIAKNIKYFADEAELKSSLHYVLSIFANFKEAEEARRKEAEFQAFKLHMLEEDRKKAHAEKKPLKQTTLNFAPKPSSL